jgi:hypothetical protein
MIITIISILILLIEIIFKPRLDYTSEGWLILWYGHKVRKYTRIL